MQFHRLFSPVPVIVALAACAGDASSPTNPVAPNQPVTPVDTGAPAGPGTNLTYRYNAKFEPPIGRVVHGLGQWPAYNTKYAALFPQANQPASELSFIPIADTVRTRCISSPMRLSSSCTPFQAFSSKLGSVTRLICTR